MNLIIENKQYDSLWFLGDTHGENMAIAPHLLRGKADREEKKAIVHVGDFGVGFCPTLDGEFDQLETLDVRLRSYNITLFVVRGNHDNPYFWNTKETLIQDCMNDNMIENIIFVPDHTLLTIELKDRKEPVKIYCNGGAVSVDRINRTANRSYWWDEHFSIPSAKELAEIPNDLDVVVTHTRPTGVWPIDKNNIQYWLLRDMSLDRDLEVEGMNMKTMFDSIKEDNKKFIHYYGHFHKSNTEFIGDVKHQALDIKELVEFRNTQ